MELEVILGIVAALMTGVAAVFGRAWKKIVGKLGKGLVLIIEASDVAAKIRAAAAKLKEGLADDGKLDREEMKAVIDAMEGFDKELDDVKVAWKALVGKEQE